MGKILKNILIAIIAIIVFLAVYRLLFVKTVYYEIGGVKIPSKYSVLTGRVKPILNYNGKAIKRTVEDRKIQGLGLSKDEVTLAQFRWAVFEQWVAVRPEYKGWNSNPDIFKKANIAFQREMDTGGFKVKVVK